MKRTAIIVALVVLCVAAVGYRPASVAWERHTREQQRLARLAESKPLVLDAVTQAILTGADRVETFRLADFHEGEMGRSPEEDAVLSGPHAPFLDDHAVLRVGPPQDQAFAATLRSALAQAGAEENGAMCFDPGVGYRVWKGQSHADICVCFYCEAIEIITKDARHKVLHQSRTDMGHARAAFLALSRQAFPQDKALAALKTS